MKAQLEQRVSEQKNNEGLLEKICEMGVGSVSAIWFSIARWTSWTRRSRG